MLRCVNLAVSVLREPSNTRASVSQWRSVRERGAVEGKSGRSVAQLVHSPARTTRNLWPAPGSVYRAASAPTGRWI